MNTELKFYNSGKKLMLYLVLSVAMVAMGVVFLYKIHDTFWDVAFGLFITLFFTLGCIVFTYQLCNRKPQVIINEIGVWTKSLEPNSIILWDDIRSSFVYPVFAQKFICIETAAKVPFHQKRFRKLGALDKKLGAGDFNIPVSSLKVNIERLAALFYWLPESTAEERIQLLQAFKNESIK